MTMSAITNNVPQPSELPVAHGKDTTTAILYQSLNNELLYLKDCLRNLDRAQMVGAALCGAAAVAFACFKATKSREEKMEGSGGAEKRLIDAASCSKSSLSLGMLFSKKLPALLQCSISCFVWTGRGMRDLASLHGSHSLRWRAPSPVRRCN